MPAPASTEGELQPSRPLKTRAWAVALAAILLILLAGPSAASLAAGTVIAWGNPGGPETRIPPGLSDATAIAAATYHSLALREDGTVVYWGSNPFGPAINTNLPAGLTNISAIAVGYAHNLALRRDGCVLAWGAGMPGATGALDHAQSVVPPDLTNAMAIAAGNAFSLALRSNGTVVAWGTLSNVPPNLGNVRAIAAGSTHALALRADGTVAVWRNEEPYNGVITNVPAGLSNVVAIAAGSAFSLALRNDGTVVGWGVDYYGQIDVPPGLSNVVGIACGEFHSLAIRQDRTVVAWGAGGSGSDPNSWPNTGQAVVPFGLTNVSAVSGGYFCSLALYDGSPALTTSPASQTNYTGATITFTAAAVGVAPFWCQWLFNGADLPGATNLALVLTNVQLAQAGNYRLVISNACGSLVSPEATLSLSTSPPLILQQPTNAVSLAGSNGTFSVGAAGSLPMSYQWRFNGETIAGATDATLSLTNLPLAASGSYDVVLTNLFGSLTSSVACLAVTPSYVIGWGEGSYGKTNHPPNLANVVAIAAGRYHSLALQASGTVVAWGGSNAGQTNVPAGLSNVTAIAAGRDFSVALKADGTVVAWGDNTYGQTDVPADLSNVVAIAAGDCHALAVKRDGTLAGWGYFVVRDRTVQVPFWIPAGITDVIAVATGTEHALALKRNGTVTAWGYNYIGGLTNVPSGLTNVAAIAAGFGHSLALKDNGTVVAWGWPPLLESATLVPAGLSDVVGIAAGRYHSGALKSDGTVVIWGDSSHGQKNVPPGLSNVVALAAGDYHILAVWDPSPLSLALAEPAKTNLTFSLSVPTFNSRTYSLEYKAALDASRWSLLRLAAGVGEALRLSDSAATNSQGFYRVRQW